MQQLERGLRNADNTRRYLTISFISRLKETIPVSKEYVETQQIYTCGVRDTFFRD